MIVTLKNISNKSCRHASCMVPPSPSLLLELYARWMGLIKEGRLPKDVKFEQFYATWRSSRRSENFIGLDDGHLTHQKKDDAPQLINRPPKKLKGVVRTIVLLVDFPDRPHNEQRSESYYRQMLFGNINEFPTRSMAEYYRNISNYSTSEGETGIDIQGEVHGWFRMPQSSDYYTSGASGMGDYPRNAQGMAEDAIKEALLRGVDFSSYDALGEGMVTALFIIHSGRGAEETGSRNDIWSLKWVVPQNIKVADNMVVSTFLTVPEDCQMGVCAHEWGHLAARWADFYDTGRVDSSRSNGLGNYCLMASGSWNNGGITPGLPNGMLRMFHNWIEPLVITESQRDIVLKPAAEGGTIVVLKNSLRMTDEEQYVFVEYRRRKGQDYFLPDEGLSIYTVDERIDNVNNEHRLAIEILQADGRRDLAKIFGQGNRGDGGDLYPHVVNGKVTQTKIDKNSKPSINDPYGTWTGITIEIEGKAGDAEMTIHVTMKP